MSNSNRRRFLKQVGGGMLVAGLGSQLAIELGVATERDLEVDTKLDFGDLTSWVRRMQEMKPDRLQQSMVQSLKSGSVSLKQLTSAAALANAETFGGQDYVGYHAEMALIPALQMSAELTSDRAALPVLKVLYRNSSRIQKFGPKKKTLTPVNADVNDIKPSVDVFGPTLRQLVREADMDGAEQLFTKVVSQNRDIAFDTLLYTIADEVDVHRFVLAYRGLTLIDVAGEEHAHTLLRQCVRHCVDFEVRRESKGRKASPIRRHIPKLVVEYKLDSTPIGTKEPDNKWVRDFAKTIYDADKFQAATAAAEALAEGISPKTICQAISLAANQLTLRQSGNPLRTHGASAGVHGSDAANAWRHMIDAANDFNKKIGVLVSAWHTGKYFQWETQAYPLDEHFEKVTTEKPAELIGLCEEAIVANDQPTAAAAIARYGSGNHDPEVVFDLLLKYAISEDGRLHSEKFYRTVREEFTFTRPAFRWDYLTALARVTASAYAFDVNDNHGHRAPGYVDACKLLGVQA